MHMIQGRDRCLNCSSNLLLYVVSWVQFPAKQFLRLLLHADSRSTLHVRGLSTGSEQERLPVSLKSAMLQDIPRSQVHGVAEGPHRRAAWRRQGCSALARLAVRIFVGRLGQCHGPGAPPRHFQAQLHPPATPVCPDGSLPRSETPPALGGWVVWTDIITCNTSMTVKPSYRVVYEPCSVNELKDEWIFSLISFVTF